MLKYDINLECIYTELPFEQRFAAAKKDGFDLIEIWGWADKDPAQVRALMDENGQSMALLSCGDGPFSMCDPKEKADYLDYLERAVKAAKIMGAKVIGLHSDALQEWPQYAKPLSEDYSDIRKYCAMYDVLKEIAPMAESEDLIFTLEPLNTVQDHCGNFLDTTEKTAELIKAVGSSNIKILYDAYHMYLNEGRICEITEKYLPLIQHIHIADAPGRHEPGTGVIHYANYFKFLEEKGYGNTIGFELMPQETSEKAMDAIKKAIGMD